MKIKQKKELNLSQLIEWGFKQIELPPLFYGSREGSLVQFTPGGWVNIVGIEPTDTFTVEVEEEIDEDTHLDYLYALTNDDEKEIRRCMNFTIRTASMVIGRNDLTFFTLIDNDLVKIYENGKMVE